MKQYIFMVVTIFIGGLIIIYTLSKIYKPIPNTKVELIKKLSTIDRNTTSKTDTLVDSVTGGKRGIYE